MIPEFQAHVDEYCQTLKYIGVAQSTINNYTSYLSRFLAWIEANKDITDLHEIPWSYFREYEGYLQTTDGLKGNTVNQHICAIKKYYEVVMESEWNKSAVPKVKYDQYRGDVPDSNDVVTIISSAPFIDYKLAFSILAFCGLRISELVNLTYSDIRRDRKTLYVKKSKGHEDREIPLSPTMIQLFEKYVRAMPKPWPKSSDFIFPGRKPGTHVTTKTIENHLIKTLKIIGWQDRNYACHSLRRYFGCKQYLAHPDDLPRLAAIMGHKSISSTMIYIRLAAAFKAAEEDFVWIDEILGRTNACQF